jgi:flagellar hook-basal body complex protein FliE
MLLPTNPAIQEALGTGRIAVPTPQAGSKTSEGGDFAKTLMDAIKEVNTIQNQSGQMENDFVTGRRPVEYHDLMISMQKASTAMQLTMAVRNKVLDAYTEIDHMQV